AAIFFAMEIQKKPSFPGFLRKLMLCVLFSRKIYWKLRNLREIISIFTCMKHLRYSIIYVAMRE
ncbi:MAG: hypothetical protein PHN99_08255, partial [Eubacteriales bacterium]|nr:hypothetical protein [Eubacteriales bacterium]